MIELLIIHVLCPIEERSGGDLRQHPRLAGELDDLLLQIGKLVVLCEGKELIDLVHTLYGSDGGSGLRGVGGQVESVFVEELEHLLEGDGVVRHEGEDILLGRTPIGFGLLDLQRHDGGAMEDGFVGVERGAVRTAFGAELDDEDGGSEVAVSCQVLGSYSFVC